MKKPVILKADLVVIGTTIVCTAIGMFTAYRYGRKAEIKELVDIVVDQGSIPFAFKIGNHVTTIGMEHIIK